MIDRSAPLRFLQTAYDPEDWVAVFLKSYETGRTAQRVGPISLMASARFQAWLRAQNAARSSVYVSVNALTPGQRSRRREAIHAIRHVFLDVDNNAPGVLAALADRPDLPSPSYTLHSSVNRAHVLWQVMAFTTASVEALQKQLALELGTDRAATSASQTTRLPGFLNHKYTRPPLVTVQYQQGHRPYTPADFPTPIAATAQPSAAWPDRPGIRPPGVLDRARCYLAAVPPAIAGQHGDVLTFRVCCRLVRGFALTDGEAFMLLTRWNARCQPPWSERELTDKLSRARRYGREPIAGLLEGQP